MTGHLDLDALADLLAGEGDDAQVDHVGGCAACSAALVELEEASAEVSAALAALPAPQVPEGLAARLDAALRAERRDVASARPVVAPLPLEDADHDARAGARVVPLSPRRRRPLLLGAAAAAAAVVLGGTAVTTVLRGGADSVASTAGSAGPESAAEGGRGAAPQAAAPGTEDGPGPDYGPGTAGLADALPRLLAAPPADRSTPGDGLERLHDPAGLAACLSALPGPAASPLALDYARYDGAPALVVVRPSVDAGSVEVAVVGAQCRAGSADTRLVTRLPRPS